MKKLPKKTNKAIRKAVRKALKKHSIATGVFAGVTTAVALSATGVSRKLADSIGMGIGNFLAARPRGDGGFLREVRHAAGDALTRAGHYFHPEPEQNHEPKRTRRAAGTPSDS